MMERIDAAPDTVVSQAYEKVNDGLKVLRAKIMQCCVSQVCVIFGMITSKRQAIE